MRRPISPPTTDPAIPRSEVARNPIWSAPGSSARASRPMMKPVISDHRMWSMRAPSHGPTRDTIPSRELRASGTDVAVWLSLRRGGW